MIQLSDAMLEQIIAGLQELRESRAGYLSEKYDATQKQIEKYREELANALDEINRNIRESSFVDTSASVGDSTSRSECFSHEYVYHHAEESKASQRDFDRLAHTVSELQENGITRIDFHGFMHDVEMKFERLRHDVEKDIELIKYAISTIEDKTGGRCYATIHADSTMTRSDGSKLP